MRARNLVLLVLVNACSSSKDEKKTTPPPPPATPPPQLGLGEISEIQGPWVLKSGDWTKVVQLPAVSGGEGLVQVYYGKEIRAEVILKASWNKDTGTMLLDTQEVTINKDGRYLCGKSEEWKVQAYDPEKSISLSAVVPGGLVPASCFGDEMRLVREQDMVYRRADVKDLVGQTCSVTTSQDDICKLPLGPTPACSEEYSTTLKAQHAEQGPDFVIGRWFKYSDQDIDYRCRVLAGGTSVAPEPVPVPDPAAFTAVFQPVDRVTCKEANTTKAVGGTFNRLAFAFDECEFHLNPQQDQNISLNSMRVLNSGPEWTAAFKKSEEANAGYHVTLKRDTSLAQFSDFIPREDLRIELNTTDVSGKSLPLILTVSKPMESDFYSVDLSQRTAYRRFVRPENADRVHEVTVQGRKTSDGIPVFRYGVFKDQDATEDRFIYHSIDPIILDTNVKISAGFGLGALRNQYTVAPTLESELAGLFYEKFRSLTGYSGTFAWEKAFEGIIDLSSDPLSTYMTSYSRRIDEEKAILDLSYISGFRTPHTIRSTVLLTSRRLSDDLKLTKVSSGNYSLKNEAAYSLFPLRGSYYFKCGQKSKSVDVEGRYFPSRTAMDWGNPGPNSEVLTFSTADIIKSLDPCTDGWKLESIGIWEVTPDEYPGRETTMIAIPG